MIQNFWNLSYCLASGLASICLWRQHFQAVFMEPKAHVTLLLSLMTKVFGVDTPGLHGSQTQNGNHCRSLDKIQTREVDCGVGEVTSCKRSSCSHLDVKQLGKTPPSPPKIQEVCLHQVDIPVVLYRITRNNIQSNTTQ